MSVRQFSPIRRDEHFMRRAVALAERGLGETCPNPAVGCLLVLRGRVVGEGFHFRAGSPHAEALALRAAGRRARGATAYVTLEPCAPNPAKRTPPCAPRLIEAGIRRVVYGAKDMNPWVRGRGERLLRSAGIAVLGGVCRGESERLTQHFNTAMKLGRPFVTLKAGMTLDGRIATTTGESRWITSAAQRRTARSLRRLFDGVLVGVQTALTDDPLLLPAPRTKRPFHRVVLDSRLRLPVTSRLVATAKRHPLIVVCARALTRKRRALEACGAIVIETGVSSRVSLRAALNALFARGLRSLMVEGGSEILGSFVRERRFDEFVMFRAPMILGGRTSLPVVGGPGPSTLRGALRMRLASIGTSAALRYGLPSAHSSGVEVYVPLRKR